MDKLTDFFRGDYMPHGHCFLYEPSILWTQVISDLMIAASYFSIPLALILIVRKKKDWNFHGIFFLFASFILLCGVTHLFSIYTIWHGEYGTHALLKALTAVVSLATAIILFKNMDEVINLPTHSELNSEKEKSFTLEQEYKREQAQRLKSLGLLAGGIAHDFNNIVTGILGLSELSLAKTNGNKELEAFQKNIIESCERASILTDRMLSYAGKSIKPTETLDVDLEIQSILVLLDSAIPKNIDMSFEPSEHDKLLHIDPALFQQLITNTVINAAEAIDEGQGSIMIKTGVKKKSVVQLKTYKTLEPLKAGKYLSISIRDNGKGIDKDTLKLIFEPFFSTKETGRGLGLSAILGILKANHGGIKIKSKTNVGTFVEIILPQKDIKLEEATFPPKPTKHSKTALVVDDEKTIRLILSHILSDMGYNVIEAADGEKALATYEETHYDFDVIFLDINMPNMMGDQVYKELKARNCTSKIIIISGYNEIELDSFLSQDGFINGHDMYLKKPISIEKIQSLISEKNIQP